MDVQQVRKFLDLRDEISALKAKVKKLEAERDRVSEAVLGEMVQDGAQSIKVDGYTVYVHCATSASAPGPEAAAAAAADGLASVCGVQPARLGTVVRELGLDQMRELYPTFVGFVQVYEKQSVRARRA